MNCALHQVQPLPACYHHRNTHRFCLLRYLCEHFWNHREWLATLWSRHKEALFVSKGKRRDDTLLHIYSSTTMVLNLLIILHNEMQLKMLCQNKNIEKHFLHFLQFPQLFSEFQEQKSCWSKFCCFINWILIMTILTVQMENNTVGYTIDLEKFPAVQMNTMHIWERSRSKEMSSCGEFTHKRKSDYFSWLSWGVSILIISGSWRFTAGPALIGNCGDRISSPSTSSFSASALSNAAFATLVTHTINTTASKIS